MVDADICDSASFRPDKPDQACEHCKRRGLRCGDKLPTERKRQLNQSQDEHSFVRTIDSSWVPTPPNSQAQYRYTDEPRQYSTYVNGITPRPVAPAVMTPNGGPSVTNILDADSSRPKAICELCA